VFFRSEEEAGQDLFRADASSSPISWGAAYVPEFVETRCRKNTHAHKFIVNLASLIHLHLIVRIQLILLASILEEQVTIADLFAILFSLNL
jgi:hypothetical protein